MINLDNVKFAYPGANEYAIKGISININAGEFVALLGHNGCGKSTVAKLLNGLILPRSGEVKINGLSTKDKHNLYDIRHMVGLVFQNPDNQAVASIIEDDVAFGLENLGIPSKEIRIRVDNALRAVGMYEYKDKTPYRLSGGQKQRVAIAGVIAMDPKIVVFDEATSMLDPKGRSEVLKVAENLVIQGTTVIMVTHHIEEAAIANRIVVLDKGRIVLDGDKSVLQEVDRLQTLSLDSTIEYMLASRLQKNGYNVFMTDDIDKIISDYIHCNKNKDINNNYLLSTKIDNNSLKRSIDTTYITKDDNLSLDTNIKDINNNAIVNAVNLSYIYSPKSAFRQVAINNINIQINEGDFYGIIGHTGSGKSTFVMHLNGLTKLMEGDLTVCEIDLSKKYDYKRLRSQVGIVFQYPEYQLFDETVFKDVSFGPKNIGLDKDEIDKRVKESLKLVGLKEDIYDKSPFDLSGGQKRRVALAGIIAMKPKLLVLDEPTAGLDPYGKKEILALIKDLQKECSAIIMISHNMDEIAMYCNKVAVFDSGEIISCGVPYQVFENVDKLKRVGLDIPQITKIVNKLRLEGVMIPTDIFDINSLVDNLIKFKN